MSSPSTKTLEQLLHELKDEIGKMPKFIGPQAKFYEAQIARLIGSGIFAYNPDLIVELLLATGEKLLELEDQLSKLENLEKPTKKR